MQSLGSCFACVCAVRRSPSGAGGEETGGEKTGEGARGGVGARGCAPHRRGAAGFSARLGRPHLEGGIGITRARKRGAAAAAQAAHSDSTACSPGTAPRTVRAGTGAGQQRSAALGVARGPSCGAPHAALLPAHDHHLLPPLAPPSTSPAQHVVRRRRQLAEHVRRTPLQRRRHGRVACLPPHAPRSLRGALRGGRVQLESRRAAGEWSAVDRSVGSRPHCRRSCHCCYLLAPCQAYLL